MKNGEALPVLTMAKLYFYYSAMNAGKSTNLLQSSHNYQERGMNTLLLTPEIDERAGIGKIASRIGLEAGARTFHQDDDLHALVEASEDDPALSGEGGVACVLIDEAQFLTRLQVEQLAQVSDDLDIPVLCCGLRTDFQGNLFPGRGAGTEEEKRGMR